MNLKSQFTKDKLKKKKKNLYTNIAFETSKKNFKLSKTKEKTQIFHFLFSPSLFSRKNIKTGPI